VTRLEPIPDDDNPVGAVPVRQWLHDFDIRILDHTEILAHADDASPIDAAPLRRRDPRPGGVAALDLLAAAGLP
jgi:hypothetical protein